MLARQLKKQFPNLRLHLENVLQVGVTPTAPPLIFYQDNGVVGLEAEFAGALAKSLGKTARFRYAGMG